MDRKLKFINDIVKPWDELNVLLIQRKAFQPDLSTVTTLVASIATAIKHQIDIHAIEIGESPSKFQHKVDSESLAAKLVSDVSDVAKHVKLRNPQRQNKIFVASMFEVNDEGYFRFLRNGVFVEHVTHGRSDFMQISHVAIHYWLRKRNLNISWSSSIAEANSEFFSTAFVHFDSKYCIEMTSTRIMFFHRNASGSLDPFEPPEVRFEVR